MTAYTVQYELPAHNPSISVRKKVSKRVVTFYVPINHSDAHSMGYQDLIAAAELSGLSVLSTPPNKNMDLYEERVVLEKAAKKQLDKATPGRVVSPA